MMLTHPLITRPSNGRPMAFEVLHHTGSESGIDWGDITIGIVVRVVLAAVGFLLYKVGARRRE